jgi:serine/threonine protein kinase
MPRNCQLGPVLSYGSEGTVHSGTWRGTPAAVKVLSNQYVRRAENEMKLVSNFNHANIIKYFDLEHEQATAYLVMEYITGGNLYEFIRSNFSSSTYWTITCQILADVARGMIYLHDRNVIQGDLKSHNILIRDGTHQAVICDFGISRSLEDDTQVKKRYNSAKGILAIFLLPE